MWKRSNEVCKYRLKIKKDMYNQEEERSYVFKPDITNKIEPLVMKEVKGMNQFVERQRVAKEAKEKLEIAKNKDIASNWVRRITIPEEFNFSTTVNNASKTKRSSISPSKPKTEPIDEDLEYEKAKQAIHLKIHEA